jgi:hypothetical protein
MDAQYDDFERIVLEQVVIPKNESAGPARFSDSRELKSLRRCNSDGECQVTLGALMLLPMPTDIVFLVCSCAHATAVG